MTVLRVNAISAGRVPLISFHAMPTTMLPLRVTTLRKSPVAAWVGCVVRADITHLGKRCTQNIPLFLLPAYQNCNKLLKSQAFYKLFCLFFQEINILIDSLFANMQ